MGKWREVIPPLTTVAIFVLSIGISFWDEGLVRICWVLILPVSIILNAKRRAA